MTHLYKLTMTEAAARRFIRAMSYAEALVHNQAESNQAPVTKQKIEEHGEWLRWGIARTYHLLPPREDSSL